MPSNNTLDLYRLFRKKLWFLFDFFAFICCLITLIITAIIFNGYNYNRSYASKTRYLIICSTFNYQKASFLHAVEKRLQAKEKSTNV